MEYSREIARVGNANEKRRLIDERRKLRKRFKEYKKQGKLSGGRGKLMSARQQCRNMTVKICIKF